MIALNALYDIYTRTKAFIDVLFGASCRWVFPFIGHMGICTSSGIIRDFAGSYFVSVSVIVCSAIEITMQFWNLHVEPAQPIMIYGLYSILYDGDCT